MVEDAMAPSRRGALASAPKVKWWAFSASIEKRRDRVTG
jgi:hypothetical protein